MLSFHVLLGFPGGKFLIGFLTKYCIFLSCFMQTTCLALRDYYDFKITALLDDLNSLGCRDTQIHGYF
jgi:hypothetical protein